MGNSAYGKNIICFLATPPTPLIPLSLRLTDFELTDSPRLLYWQSYSCTGSSANLCVSSFSFCQGVLLKCQSIWGNCDGANTGEIWCSHGDKYEGWDVASCSLLHTDRHLERAYCFRHYSDESLMMKVESSSETSVGICQTTRCKVAEDVTFNDVIAHIFYVQQW